MPPCFLTSQSWRLRRVRVQTPSPTNHQLAIQTTPDRARTPRIAEALPCGDSGPNHAKVRKPLVPEPELEFHKMTNQSASRGDFFSQRRRTVVRDLQLSTRN